MHDAAVRALTAERQFSPGTNFKAWIFTILRNLYYNRWREQRVRSAILEDPALAGERLGPPQEAALKIRDFKRAFWQLGQDQREALILVGASGMSYEEAAAICQCPVGTVKSRVSRARQQLMQHHHADRAPPDHVEVDDTSSPGDSDRMLSDDAPPRVVPPEEPRQRLPRRGKSVPHHAALRVAK